MTGLLLLTGCTAGSGTTGPAPEAAAEVSTDVGTLRGVVDGNVLRWRGIPFAEPPVGDRRWEPPVPAPAWPGVRDASRSGPPCPQQPGNFSEAQTNEDCLHLDVTAPAKAGANRPVMVWLHGGLAIGSAGMYDTRRLAVQGDVVVVSVDFRMGLFGQLALPGMRGGATFGTADQQEALRFVRRNAAAFGGDPGNVTLFGESGGGVAICTQLASPAAEGLFDKAILQSSVGSCSDPVGPDVLGPGSNRASTTGYIPLAKQESNDLGVIAKLGCTDPATALRCARKLPASALLTQVQPGAGSIGVAPGSLLPRSPMDAVTNGTLNKVPVLAGGTRDEAQYLLFVALSAGLPPLTATSYEAIIRKAYGKRADAVLAAYPVTRYASPNAAWIAQASDRGWACPAAVLNDRLSRHTPVYGYEFADRTAPLIPLTPGQPLPASLPTDAAGHSAELAYLFDYYDVASKPGEQTAVPTVITGGQVTVANEMIKVWSDFAHSGTPNVPTWSPQQHTAVAFGESGPADLWKRHNCDFWADDISTSLKTVTG